MPKPKRIDLTDKQALVSAFKKHHDELWPSFGTPHLYKDYDVNKVIEFINSIIEKEHAHISPEKKDEIFSTLQKFGNNAKKAMQYIANVFLKGAGLGLNEADKKQLIRTVVREEIRKILVEKDAGIKYAEKLWDDEGSEDSRNTFFKKFRGLGFPWNITTKKDEIMGKSFKELPKPVQQAWEHYIHKMK